ncbi:Imm50 family immunity protein [Streptomyces sp. NPDC090108]|uniref:Imm50 family immunity protein n=1 Tax=Streptomyces sp. NPDC090108 TaxID=3365947 RepID=UPI00381CA5FF
MSWISLLHNPEGISAVYQGDPPALSDVRVREVTLHEDGPVLRMRVDLPRYPSMPPRKWTAQGFNTVQIEISFSGLRTVTLEGFGSEVTASISLSGDDGVHVDVRSPEMRIEAVSDTAHISQLTAYADTAK